MSVKTAPHHELECSDAASGRIFALALGGAAVVMLLGAGGLLWWRHGDAVFTEIALAGLAWCF